ncbi:MAG: hypothetical protein ACSLFM_15060 [Tepidiformaceae bacterium]
MTRKQLDVLLSGGGFILAVLLLVLGVVLADQKAFADDYVKEELGAQKITFAATDRLTDEEKNWKPGSSCLEENAGKVMETGKQAECYAKYYIAKHMDTSAKNAGFEGETYATLGPIRTALQAEVKEATDKGDSVAAAEAQKKLDAATSLRGTLQTGETLRGLLLTTYGFSIFGDKAGLAATVCYGAAALLAVLAVAGLVHAFVGTKGANGGSRTT